MDVPTLIHLACILLVKSISASFTKDNIKWNYPCDLPDCKNHAVLIPYVLQNRSPEHLKLMEEAADYFSDTTVKFKEFNLEDKTYHPIRKHFREKYTYYIHVNTEIDVCSSTIGAQRPYLQDREKYNDEDKVYVMDVPKPTYNLWIKGCPSKGDVAHELMHVLGFVDEQRRPVEGNFGFNFVDQSGTVNQTIGLDKFKNSRDFQKYQEEELIIVLH